MKANTPSPSRAARKPHPPAPSCERRPGPAQANPRPVPTSPSPQHSLSPAACPLKHSSLSPDADITHAPQQRQRDRAGASIEGKHPKPLARSAKTSPPAPSCERRPGPAQANPRPVPTSPSPPHSLSPAACPQTHSSLSPDAPDADITHAPQQRQRDRAGASIEGKHPKPLARSAKTHTLLRLPASAVQVPRKPTPGPCPRVRPHNTTQPVPSSLSPEASLGRNWRPQTSPPIRTDRISLESEGLWRDPEPCLSPADYNCGPLPG